ncbi:GH36-type glycosyl hydrolase domain-containing protein [Lentibacillus sediminis]|uniref:GH36-type glycosyl hydrolase domain-containing protein n=1 Tax=Lentibacillus sediminis TaxID=1940529 RepID=UPI000C1C1488|nr:cellobiose phosphorylase [Lentibacillus sediminis]
MNQHKPATFSLEAGDLRFEFLYSGDIYAITHKNTMINQLLANPVDGSLNNIYLRVHDGTRIKAVPLLGVKSDSRISKTDSQVVWQGNAEGVAYQVTFRLSDKGIWFWDVQLNGQGQEVDLIYTQDLGLADKGAVRANEAYMSQYMDHSIFEDDEHGYTVCTRQNQPQEAGFPYLQQGSLGRSVGYSTDGFQFFGLSYKTDHVPQALEQSSLANEVYQYEFAFTALQSEKIRLNGPQQFVFYGQFQANHSDAVTELEYQPEREAAWEQVSQQEFSHLVPLPGVKRAPQFGAPLSGEDLSEEDIFGYFPHRRLEERQQKQLLSFFTDTYEHVVLKKKEELVERPHGHILMSGNNHRVKKDTVTSNVYMYGVFNSQIAIGNTNMNKMLSNTRNPLNVMKTSGQRIYIEIDGCFRILTMPSMFEIGFNYARWFYKLDGDVIVVTNFTTVDSADIQLEVASEKGEAYRYLISNQVTMNNNEYEVPFDYESTRNGVVFSAGAGAESVATYPELHYRLEVKDVSMQVKDGSYLTEGTEADDPSLIVLEIAPTAEWTLNIRGSLDEKTGSIEQKYASEEIARYREYYKEIMRGFHLNKTGSDAELDKVNAIAWWYTHNMLVHFSVPHGLEQYGGAAWGTRDVSQGPFEYFLATQHDETVQEIIKTIYSHQYEDTGDWPQWFMFDKYTHIQQTDSHGDIIVWPLKVIGEYIEMTGDTTILQEQVPYMDRQHFTFTETTESIFAHVKKQISYIKAHFLHDTFLSAYDDGDWDDTLQPANANLKKYMASSWTVALTYQSVSKLAKVLQGVDEQEAAALSELAEGIQRDYRKYILQTEVIPGFVYMEQPEKAEFMLHPSDSRTGIDYRLLPMQESIISELFTPEQAAEHYQLIKKHLFFPDGVRLMNRPANYAGGVSTHFKRAEQSANFGREIGLQYVHAHIRFVEAMAKLGKTGEVWNGLSVINPIDIQRAVPNAELRQSNTYFSSSDGKFATRYDAKENFEKLRDGSIPVKGGWRIYSSGPGIYMNQLITNTLGIRREQGDLVLDPVLPMELDGLRLDYQFAGLPVTFVYHLQAEKRQVKVNGETVFALETANPYRQGGFRVKGSELERRLTTEGNTVEIYL